MIERAVIIGSGNLAEALARAVGECDALELVQLFARNPERGPEVARLAGTTWCDDPQRLAEADIYLIAVSDKAVGEVAAALPLPDGAVVAHTAGSVPLEALPGRFGRAVCYPMQTFTKGRRVDFGRIPIFVEAEREQLLAEVEAFAGKLSGTVIRAGSAQRAQVHLAAVFVSNFVNHMYALGERIVRRAGLDFDVLRPLVAETVAKALEAPSPACVQTGPAARGDLPTQERHLALLGDELERTIYRTISQSIWEISKRTSPAAKPSSSTSTE